jgi:predicted O-linked N-acetylglucosamine transferase (SPINDLY family)
MFDVLVVSARCLSEAFPNEGHAWHLLGIGLYQQKRLVEAEPILELAITLLPKNAHVKNSLGNVYSELSKSREAVSVYQKAVELAPDFAIAWNNLGNAYCSCNQLENSISCFEKAISILPTYAAAHSNAAMTYRTAGRLEEAKESCLKALELQPDLTAALVNLSSIVRLQGHVSDSIVLCHDILNVYPNIAEVWSNLGDAYTELCAFDKGADAYISALALPVEKSNKFIQAVYSSLVFCLNYHPDLSAEAIYGAYQDYETRFGVPLRLQWIVPVNARVPDKRLKVGYVSAGFSNSSCKYFLEPLMAHHDHRQIEVYAYSEQLRSDEYTERYQGYADHWISTMGLSDDELTEQIRRDGIDILVDISGHTEGHRLLVFARKPAPVSIHWLDFGYTTGLKAIDYYLCDQHTVPEGSEDLFSEKPWRLDSPPFSYRPSEGMGEVGALPALSKGYITFGTLTRSIRINYRVVRAWAALLKAVPGSRLVIDSGNFKGEEATTMMKQKFAEQGISEDRLDIGFHSPPWDLLRTIDIGLDCFPHNSGTTLFEMLYMGVPFITIAGRPSVGTLGAGILEGVGHLEWIARNEEEYVEKGVQLANDVAQLARLRMALRGQMQASPVMDEVGFARSLEHAYRQMWCLYCSKQVEG